MGSGGASDPDADVTKVQSSANPLASSTAKPLRGVLFGEERAQPWTVTVISLWLQDSAKRRPWLQIL